MSLNRVAFTSDDIKAFINKPISGPLEHGEGDALPRISVVVPSFNQGRFLERTILSIINQNYPNTELIVIDGGSTDETLSVIKKYEDIIAYWVSEPDNGQSEALNKGLFAATGEIFAWQNSDDIYLPGAFASVSRVFMEHPQISVCYGNWISIDENDNITDIHYALRPRYPHAPFENMDVYNQAMFWRCSCCKACGGFDESLHSLMDTDFMIRTMQALGPEGYHKVEVFLGAFRWYSEQKTDFLKMTDQQQAEERYIEEKYHFLPKDSMKGKYYRTRYRLAQLFESLRYGGFSYTGKKFKQTYRRRGKFI